MSKPVGKRTLIRRKLIRRVYQAGAVMLSAMVITIAVIGLVNMVHKQKVNHDKLNQLIKNEQKLKEDSISKQKELENQIEELKKQVEAKKQSKLAQAANAAAQQVVPKAQAATMGTCQDWMVAAGVTDIANAYTIIMRESGCNPNAVNKSSGACGIPQALPCSKLGTSDPVEQIRWMQNYVINRYGSWAGAVSFWNQHHWY